LIPLLLQVASGRRPSAQIFGRDYDTPDGTCIRDYVHVLDLCDAHLSALQFLQEGRSGAFNLGNGNGFSVLEVLAAVEKITGRRLDLIDAPRRDGDPARLVADASRARRELSWSTQYSDLEIIVRHAWRWESKCAAAS
jgi:UDP-glucose 4-epimerase